jgi:hypothetical protein
MHSSLLAPVAALAYASVAAATSLSDICTDSYAQAALPLDAIDGITVDASSVTTSLVTNYTASSIFYPTETFNYCNLTFAYSHNGIEGDIVHVQYWLPDQLQEQICLYRWRWLGNQLGKQFYPYGNHCWRVRISLTPSLFCPMRILY